MFCSGANMRSDDHDVNGHDADDIGANDKDDDAREWAIGWL